MNQKKTNQIAWLNLGFFALLITSMNRIKEIIRMFMGSKKKLNIFEKVKNKYLALNKILVG